MTIGTWFQIQYGKIKFLQNLINLFRKNFPTEIFAEVCRGHILQFAKCH